MGGPLRLGNPPFISAANVGPGRSPLGAELEGEDRKLLQQDGAKDGGFGFRGWWFGFGVYGLGCRIWGSGFEV